VHERLRECENVVEAPVNSLVPRSVAGSGFLIAAVRRALLAPTGAFEA
jgi:hypothetical protein